MIPQIIILGMFGARAIAPLIFSTKRDGAFWGYYCGMQFTSAILGALMWWGGFFDGFWS